MTVLELADVSFAYGEVPVLTDVSLTVESGSFLGLVGPNGSGKSTLVRIALGLARADAGEARLFGEPAHGFSDGHRIGYVGQGVASVDREAPITVEELVTMGRFPHAGYGRLDDADRKLVREAMATASIADLADRRLGTLSGGQRQRAFIARALACEADLLALDEPTVGVDATSRDGFYDLLRSLNEAGMTIVLVEHDIGVVTEYATSLACLNCQLHYHGPSEDFADSGALEAAYGQAQQVVEHHHSCAGGHGGEP